jgi:carboxylesterase type B
VVHSAELPYVFGPSITPWINSTSDITLSKAVQKGWIAFASHMDPNALGNLAPGLKWPQYGSEATEVLVFQTTDGTQGPPGQGLHTEKDKDNRPACDYIIAKDLDFLR